MSISQRDDVPETKTDMASKDGSLDSSRWGRYAEKCMRKHLKKFLSIGLKSHKVPVQEIARNL